jgi:hypothetical protein
LSQRLMVERETPKRSWTSFLGMPRSMAESTFSLRSFEYAFMDLFLYRSATYASRCETHHYADKRLCIHITFVIGKKSNKRDVDNMAKLLLDGLQGQMMEDDNQIDHLSLLRLTWKGDEEYIILHVRESNINRHDDVLYHSMHHSWAGQEELLLDNFIDA